MRLWAARWVTLDRLMSSVGGGNRRADSQSQAGRCAPCAVRPTRSENLGRPVVEEAAKRRPLIERVAAVPKPLLKETAVTRRPLNLSAASWRVVYPGG